MICRSLPSIGLALSLLPLHVLADPPTELDYQGKILVEGLPLSGEGYFKFALSDALSTTNFWSNDGTLAGEPSGVITNDVFNGVFSVHLGASGMQAIDRGIFSNGDDLYLRVWFSEDNTTFAELLPSQRMLSHGFAINADQVDGRDAADLIADAAGSVTLSGDITGAASATQITAGTIVDGDINATAAIDPSKIAGTALTQSTALVGDVIGTAGANQIAPGAILDGDINAGAAVDPTKIAGTALTELSVFGGDVSGTFNNLALDVGALPVADTATAGIVQMSGGFGATAPFVALDDNDTRLNSFGVVNTLTATAPNSMLSVIGTNGIVVSNTAPGTLTLSAVPPPVLSNTVYVAMNGTPAGPGTIEQPYDTAQAGYDAAAAVFPGLPAAVVLMGGGSYGPLTMHAATIHVLGESRSELDDLTVAMGVPSPPFPALGANGKQRVENIIVKGPAMVAPNGFGAWVKFHNCRFLDGLVVDESYVEVQHCAIQRRDLSSPAVSVGIAGTSITEIGFYQSSLLSVDTNAAPGAVPGTLMVGSTVMDFEVIGCQIANEGATLGGTGPAIRDLSMPIPPPMPLHLYSHNVIKGPATGTGDPAVADSVIGMPPPAGPTIVFTHNTVYGDVGGTGGIALPAGAPQFFANNTIYGLINFPPVPPAPTGWVQAGAGPGLDAAGNAEHPVGWGPGGFTLPSHWDD